MSSVVDERVEPRVEPLDDAGAQPWPRGAVGGERVERATDPAGVDLPGHHLIGIEVDGGVGVDEHVPPHAGVLGLEPWHRPREAAVEALGAGAGRVVAKRRLEPHVAVAHVRLVVLVVVEPHQPRVRDRHVVALEVVVDDDLPVDRLLAVDAAERIKRSDPVARKALGEVADLIGQGRRREIEVDEEQAAHLLDARREQAERGLVDRPEAPYLGEARSASRRGGMSSRGSGSGSPCRTGPTR